MNIRSDISSILFLNWIIWPLDLKKIFLCSHRSRQTFHPISQNADSQLNALWTKGTGLYSNWHISRTICSKLFILLSSRRWIGIGINVDVSSRCLSLMTLSTVSQSKPHNYWCRKIIGTRRRALKASRSSGCFWNFKTTATVTVTLNRHSQKWHT